MNKLWRIVGWMLMIATAARAEAPVTTIRVQTDKPGPAISPLLYGVFFEDINFAADGGLYPERVKNGSFEFTDSLMGWRKTERGGAVGGLGISEASALHPNNPHYLRINVEEPGEGFGLTKEGYRGIGVTRGAKFTFSAYARSSSPDPQILVTELIDSHSQKIGGGEISGITGEWKKLSCAIESTAAEPKARLTVLAKNRGEIDLDMVSLFPLDIPGAKTGDARLEVMSADMEAENTLDEPAKVSPKKSTVSISKQSTEREYPAHSVSVIRIRRR